MVFLRSGKVLDFHVPNIRTLELHLLQLIMRCLLILAVVSSQIGRADTVSLPDIGDSSGSTISPGEEKEVGESLLRYFRKNNLIVDDPVVQDYIQDLGYRLAAHSDQPDQPFTFFVVRDPAINAFAAPGGYIGVHSGLILTAQNESELAAVIAHEIAHITQKHMARMYESASKHRYTAAIALLAAILIGQQSTEAAQAALATGVAADAQMQINFTRGNEKEADFIGIKTLAQAGFDPSSMADFFERMQQSTRLYGDELPEFLRTHPVTENRIAESRARARNMHVEKIADSRNFFIIQAHLRVSQAQDITQFLRDYEKKDNTDAVKNDQYLYTLALANNRAGRYAAALQAITPLVNKDPNRIAYRITQAQIQLAAGQGQDALKNYTQLLGIYPNNHAITINYASALFTLGQKQKAYEVLRDYSRNRELDAPGLKLYADIAGAAGNQGEAYFALAEYQLQNGDVRQAIQQLERAQKLPDLDYYLSSKIEARLQELKDELSRETKNAKK